MRQDSLQRAPLPAEPVEPVAPAARVSRDATVTAPVAAPASRKVEADVASRHNNFLIEGYTFQSFVEGKSNQLARAAAQQVAQNPGGSYNPLFIYGGVGLGKTHLMHAVGNAMLESNPSARIVYLHSERFVADMVKALQLNAINDFKRYYRSVDALLIDDIQFFANKERSQEEFFHTFNALLEGGQQMILTCDRYPKEIDGLEERLKSRFGWGLTVAVEPPELETRVAILMKKAEQSRIDLPADVAFFVAQRIKSNVRELEGALKRVIANAQFTRRGIDIELVRESLKDLLALQDKLVSMDNIQRYRVRILQDQAVPHVSKRRSRSVARPRESPWRAKELTNHSLPETATRLVAATTRRCCMPARTEGTCASTMPTFARIKQPLPPAVDLRVASPLAQGDKEFTAETRCTKFSISRDASPKRHQLVAVAVERRQTLPILSNVLITLDGDGRRPTGTDTEVELVHASRCRRREKRRDNGAGAQLLPHLQIAAVFRRSVAPDEQRVQLRSGVLVFTLSTLPAWRVPEHRARWPYRWNSPSTRRNSRA